MGKQPQRKASELIQQWQRHILDRVSLAVFSLTALAVVLTARAEYARGEWHATLPLVFTSAGIGCFAFMRRLPLRVRTFSLLGVLIAAEIYLLVMEGYRVPNPFSAAIMTAAIAALLLSSAQAYTAFGVLLAGFAVMGYQFVIGRAHAVDAMRDITNPMHWIRILLVFGFVGGTTIWSITFLMRHLRLALTKQEELFDALITESAERINHLERERALELQLRQSQKMEALGELAGGVAHDFNNLLLVIIGGAEQAQQSNNEHERNEAVEEVIAAADRAAALTQRLLAFSRKQVAQRTLVDLNQAVGDSLRLIKRLIPSNITLHFEPAEGLGTYRGSTTELDQVLMNLCLNARDALPKGGRLQVTTRLARGKVPEADHLVLSVEDNGLGISPEHQARIFEPFFTSKEPGHGTGLGLSVVRNILDQCGGSVALRSELGKGSCFDISFPRGELIDASPNSLRRRTSGGAGEKLLVVDDSEPVRANLARTLTNAGYHPTLAATGDEAIEILRQRGSDFSLIITDVVMPGMSGRAVHDTALQLFPQLPLLVCSGYVAGTLNSDFFDQPRRAFLAKPFHSDQLLRKVGELLAEIDHG